MPSEQMHAIVIKKYGDVEHLVAEDVPKPGPPEGEDLLVKFEMVSTTTTQTTTIAFPKVSRTLLTELTQLVLFITNHTPDPYQIIGFDGSGTIEAIGPSASRFGFSVGDSVFYSGSPIRHGSNAEYQLVHAGSVAHKPSNLSFTEAAALPLTYITAYEALVERLAIPKSEKAAVLIVNGAGGVGSVASQIARTVLELPVVITTTSRPETTEWSKSLGATHTVNHREDIVAQIKALKLDVPLKYVFITHSTAPYLKPAAAVLAPFGKICSIVQTKEMGEMYGTEMLAKSISFVWCLLGTKPYYGVDLDSHGEILKELKGLVEEGKVKCTLTKTLKLTLDGLREGHRTVEGGSSKGKLALGVDVEGEGEAWL